MVRQGQGLGSNFDTLLRFCKLLEGREVETRNRYSIEIKNEAIKIQNLQQVRSAHLQIVLIGTSYRTQLYNSMSLFYDSLTNTQKTYYMLIVENISYIHETCETILWHVNSTPAHLQKITMVHFRVLDSKNDLCTKEIRILICSRIVISHNLLILYLTNKSSHSGI